MRAGRECSCPGTNIAGSEMTKKWCPRLQPCAAWPFQWPWRTRKSRML